MSSIISGIFVQTNTPIQALNSLKQIESLLMENGKIKPSVIQHVQSSPNLKEYLAQIQADKVYLQQVSATLAQQLPSGSRVEQIPNNASELSVKFGMKQSVDVLILALSQIEQSVEKTKTTTKKKPQNKVHETVKANHSKQASTFQQIFVPAVMLTGTAVGGIAILQNHIQTIGGQLTWVDHARGNSDLMKMVSTQGSINHIQGFTPAQIYSEDWLGKVVDHAISVNALKIADVNGVSTYIIPGSYQGFGNGSAIAVIQVSDTATNQGMGYPVIAQKIFTPEQFAQFLSSSKISPQTVQTLTQIFSYDGYDNAVIQLQQEKVFSELNIFFGSHSLPGNNGRDVFENLLRWNDSDNFIPTQNLSGGVYDLSINSSLTFTNDINGSPFFITLGTANQKPAIALTHGDNTLVMSAEEFDLFLSKFSKDSGNDTQNLKIPYNAQGYDNFSNSMTLYKSDITAFLNQGNIPILSNVSDLNKQPALILANGTILYSGNTKITKSITLDSLKSAIQNSQIFNGNITSIDIISIKDNSAQLGLHQSDGNVIIYTFGKTEENKTPLRLSESAYQVWTNSTITQGQDVYSSPFYKGFGWEPTYIDQAQGDFTFVSTSLTVTEQNKDYRISLFKNNNQYAYIVEAQFADGHFKPVLYVLDDKIDPNSKLLTQDRVIEKIFGNAQNREFLNSINYAGNIAPSMKDIFNTSTLKQPLLIANDTLSPLFSTQFKNTNGEYFGLNLTDISGKYVVNEGGTYRPQGLGNHTQTFQELAGGQGRIIQTVKLAGTGANIAKDKTETTVTHVVLHDVDQVIAIGKTYEKTQGFTVVKTFVSYDPTQWQVGNGDIHGLEIQGKIQIPIYHITDNSTGKDFILQPEIFPKQGELILTNMPYLAVPVKQPLGTGDTVFYQNGLKSEALGLKVAQTFSGRPVIGATKYTPSLNYTYSFGDSSDVVLILMDSEGVAKMNIPTPKGFGVKPGQVYQNPVIMQAVQLHDLHSGAGSFVQVNKQIYYLVNTADPVVQSYLSEHVEEANLAARLAGYSDYQTAISAKVMLPMPMPTSVSYGAVGMTAGQGTIIYSVNSQGQLVDGSGKIIDNAFVEKFKQNNYLVNNHSLPSVGSSVEIMYAVDDHGKLTSQIQGYRYTYIGSDAKTHTMVYFTNDIFLSPDNSAIGLTTNSK